MIQQSQAKARLAELSDHNDLKSLREEIALTRMLIERRFNMIETEADVLAAVGPLNTLLLTVERLVKSCHSIEQDTGTLLARQAVIALAQKIVEYLIDELQGVPGYEEIIDRMTEKMMTLLQNPQKSLT